MAKRSQSIEMKVNVTGDVDQALRLLDLEQGQRRQVWFLDDLTEGVDPLPLLHSGIVLRLRRRSETKADSTVKLRPCRRSQLVAPWSAPSERAPEYRIEQDWSRARRVLASSCVNDLSTPALERAVDTGDRLSDLFSEPQGDFLTGCTGIPIAIDGLTLLGPIASTQWKDTSMGVIEGVAAERWTVAGLDFLELSIRVESRSGDPAQQHRAFQEAVESKGLNIDALEEPKTERVMKRLAGLDG